MKGCQKWLRSRLYILSCAIMCSLPSAQAATPPVVADGQTVLASGFTYPQGLAVAGNGMIYVADMGNNRVVTVSSSGIDVQPYTLNGPTAVAVDGAGDLYIADAYNARVIEVPVVGSRLQVAGSPMLSLPVALAVDWFCSARLTV
jgi:hypothetical protein